MVFTVRLIQEATYRHPHPPDGNAGDVFSTTLRLFAIGPLFGKPDKSYVGTMSFSYTFQGACSSAGVGCKGTTNLDTLTKLPGGTLTANGKNVSLGRLPYVVPISSGPAISRVPRAPSRSRLPAPPPRSTTSSSSSHLPAIDVVGKTWRGKLRPAGTAAAQASLSRYKGGKSPPGDEEEID